MLRVNESLRLGERSGAAPFQRDALVVATVIWPEEFGFAVPAVPQNPSEYPDVKW